MLSDEEIREAVAAEPDPQAACNKLVDMANEKGGVDNITVVVAKVTNGPAAESAASA